MCDDSEPILRTLKHVFERQTDILFVGSASDGDDAADLVVRTRADVLVLDLHMPRVDGLTALPQIRAAAPGAAVLLYTVEAWPELRQEAVAAGASDLVVKTDVVALLTAIRRFGSHDT